MRKHNRLGVSGDMIHQQNRKVPTLIGGQYKVSQKLSGAVELGKVEANLDTSWYFSRKCLLFTIKEAAISYGQNFRVLSGFS